jgi:hypothetical protein
MSIYKFKKIINKIGYFIIKNNSHENYNFSNKNYYLKEKTIKNLKILINREKLLEYLPKNGTVAELGVDQRNFSNSILLINKPKKLYLIDSWGSERYNQDKMRFVKKRFNKEIDSEKIKIITKDSITALSKFKNTYFDWIYI